MAGRIDTLTAKAQNWLKKTGDSMISGFLTLFQDPTDAMHAVTKQYVDNLVAGTSDTWGLQDFFAQSHWGRRHVIGTASTSMSGDGIFNTGAAVAVTSPGTPSRVLLSTGLFVACATGTGASPVDAGMAPFAVANGAAQRAALPKWNGYLRLPVVAGAFNVWTGFTDATAGVSSPQAGVNPNTLHCAGFRFFPSLGGTPDTTWWAVSGNNVSGQSTNTGITVVANTLYKLTVDMTTADTIRYYVNDVLAHTESTVLPGNTTDMGIVMVLRRTSGTTDRTIQVGGDDIRYTVN